MLSFGTFTFQPSACGKRQIFVEQAAFEERRCFGTGIVRVLDFSDSHASLLTHRSQCTFEDGILTRTVWALWGLGVFVVIFEQAVSSS